MRKIMFIWISFFCLSCSVENDKENINFDDNEISKILPQQTSDDLNDEIIKDRNKFRVHINSKDEIFVEGEPVDIKNLKELTKEFLLNPKNSDDLPEMVLISEEIAKETLDSLHNKLRALVTINPEDSKIPIINAEVEYWTIKLGAAIQVGEFKTLPKLSLIEFTNENETSYKNYLAVLDTLNAAFNESRNIWAQFFLKKIIPTGIILILMI